MIEWDGEICRTTFLHSSGCIGPLICNFHSSSVFTSTFRSFSVSFLLSYIYDVHAVLPTATSILPFLQFLFSSFSFFLLSNCGFDVLWFVDVVGVGSVTYDVCMFGRDGKAGWTGSKNEGCGIW